MKIIVAPDSFKDALTALQASEAIREGVLRALPQAEVLMSPMADGGEGTAEVLAWHLGGELAQLEVMGPLLNPVLAHFLMFQNNGGKKVAFVEMAQASGLQLLKPEERNPLKTSTYGTGQLVSEALRRGATEIYLAIGGSATHDAGMGMAAALGWQFLDKNGAELAPIGENLVNVETALRSQTTSLDGGQTPKFFVLCDVTNPLVGPEGAAHVFAPQKGASAHAVRQLEEGTRHFSAVLKKQLGSDFSKTPGAGAAGGLGFGAMALLGATVQSGASVVMQLIGFEEFVKNADLVITGEGRLDGQTSHGKLIAKVCQKANQYRVPVVAICGLVDAPAEAVEKLGLAHAVQLKKEGEPLSESISKTADRLENEAYNVLITTELRTEKG